MNEINSEPSAYAKKRLFYRQSICLSYVKNTLTLAFNQKYINKNKKVNKRTKLISN